MQGGRKLGGQGGRKILFCNGSDVAKLPLISMMMMMMMMTTLKRLMPKMTTTLEVQINMKYSVRFGTKYIFSGVSFLGLC